MCAFKSSGNSAFPEKSFNGNSRKLDLPRKLVPQNNGNTAPKIEVINFDQVDEYGPSFVEAYEPTEIVTGDEEQYNNLQANEMATMRVYISADMKRTVVVKEDDLLTKKEIWSMQMT